MFFVSSDYELIQRNYAVKGPIFDLQSRVTSESNKRISRCVDENGPIACHRVVQHPLG